MLDLDQFPEDPILSPPPYQIRDKLIRMSDKEWGNFVEYLQRAKLPILPYALARRLPKFPRVLIVGEPRSGKTRGALWLAATVFWDWIKEHHLREYFSVHYVDVMQKLVGKDPPLIIYDESEYDFQGVNIGMTNKYKKFRTYLESQAYKSKLFIQIHHDPRPELAYLFNYIVVVQEKHGKQGYAEVYRIVKNVKRVIMKNAPHFWANKIEMFRFPLPPRKVEAEFRVIEPEVKRKIEDSIIKESTALELKGQSRIQEMLERYKTVLSSLDF